MHHRIVEAKCRTVPQRQKNVAGKAVNMVYRKYRKHSVIGSRLVILTHCVVYVVTVQKHNALAFSCCSRGVNYCRKPVCRNVFFKKLGKLCKRNVLLNIGAICLYCGNHFFIPRIVTKNVRIASYKQFADIFARKLCVKRYSCASAAYRTEPANQPAVARRAYDRCVDLLFAAVLIFYIPVNLSDVGVKLTESLFRNFAFDKLFEERFSAEFLRRFFYKIGNGYYFVFIHITVSPLNC